MMTQTEGPQNECEDGGVGGPGAPTPLSALEVTLHHYESFRSSDLLQGVAGLTARDIKLIVEGGYHTVEAVAYTLVTMNLYPCSRYTDS